jgi:hypothetical protein
MSESALKPVTYEEMLNDLNSIQINKSDVLFEKFSTLRNQETSTNEAENEKDLIELNSKLEKYILFKPLNQMTNEPFKSDDESSLNRLSNEIDSLEKRLSSFQHFVDVSKKFFNQ